MTDKFNPSQWLQASLAESYAGTEDVTSPPALALIKQSNLLSSAHSSTKTRILDIGCGLGQLTEVILSQIGDRGEGLEIVAGDIEPSLIEATRKKKEEGNWENVQVGRYDTMHTGLPDESFDYVFSNFLVQLIPDPINALKEQIRLLKPNSTLGLTTWAHSGPFYLLQRAHTLLLNAPNTRTRQTSSLVFQAGYWHHPAFIRDTLHSLGLVDVQIEILDYRHEAEGAGEMARKMWPVVRVYAGGWEGGLGWDMFGKIEEVLKGDYEGGRVRVGSVALVVTAKKAG